jgi:hypothetical protein
VTDEQATDTQDQDEGREDEGREDENQDASGGDQSDEVAKARKAAEEEEQAKEKVKELEEDPPEKLEDWPDDKAKYETFGGPEGDEGYEDSVTSKLGPSSLRHRDDGSVEIEGEKVDDPEEYKGDPIPGGPTDPKAADSRAYGEPDLTDETSADVEGSDDGDSDGGDSESGSESDDDGSEGESGKSDEKSDG